MKNLNKSIEIFNIRKKLDITRKEFSDALGLSPEDEKNLKLWEEGKKDVPDNIYSKIKKFPTSPRFKTSIKQAKFTTLDLFAGIGGIRLGFQNIGGHSVFASEWDKFAQKTYRINYGEVPHGDITKISENDIPAHDILLAGFPCQPFSQAGLKKGFEDIRGTLFFDVARIIKAKRPKAFLLENVKQLKGHDKGKTLNTILNTLKDLNYYVPEPEVLNAYNFGVPQNRERIIIVGFDKNLLPNDFTPFKYPKGKCKDLRLSSILEKNPADRFTISDKLYKGHLERKVLHKAKGNGFGFCLFNKNSKYTSTISARYYKDGSEALIEQANGKNPRMLTPRECARLQGFPESFVIPVSNAQAYKQFGNSVCINVIEAVAKKIIEFMEKYQLLLKK